MNAVLSPLVDKFQYYHGQVYYTFFGSSFVGGSMCVWGGGGKRKYDIMSITH